MTPEYLVLLSSVSRVSDLYQKNRGLRGCSVTSCGSRRVGKFGFSLFSILVFRKVCARDFTRVFDGPSSQVFHVAWYGGPPPQSSESCPTSFCSFLFFRRTSLARLIRISLSRVAWRCRCWTQDLFASRSPRKTQSLALTRNSGRGTVSVRRSAGFGNQPSRQPSTSC